MMITKILQEKILFYESFVKPTIADKYQFETNVRNTYMINYLAERLDFINGQKNYIDKTVFKLKRSFSVITISDYKSSPEFDHHFNAIEGDPFIFTQEHYNIFCQKYIEYQVKRFTEDLIKNKHYNNSTNPLSNLESQWITESKQNLIEFFSEIKLS